MTSRCDWDEIGSASTAFPGCNANIPQACCTESGATSLLQSVDSQPFDNLNQVNRPLEPSFMDVSAAASATVATQACQATHGVECAAAFSVQAGSGCRCDTEACAAAQSVDATETQLNRANGLWKLVAPNGAKRCGVKPARLAGASFQLERGRSCTGLTPLLSGGSMDCACHVGAGDEAPGAPYRDACGNDACGVRGMFRGNSRVSSPQACTRAVSVPDVATLEMYHQGSAAAYCTKVCASRAPPNTCFSSSVVGDQCELCSDESGASARANATRCC